MKHSESQQVLDARERRAVKLADAVLEWKRRADLDEWPRSLVEICRTALEREYRLGTCRTLRLTRNSRGVK